MLIFFILEMPWKKHVEFTINGKSTNHVHQVTDIVKASADHSWVHMRHPANFYICARIAPCNTQRFLFLYLKLHLEIRIGGNQIYHQALLVLLNLITLQALQARNIVFERWGTDLSKYSWQAKKKVNFQNIQIVGGVEYCLSVALISLSISFFTF